MVVENGDGREDPTEGDGARFFVSVVGLTDIAGINDCWTSDRDLIGEGLLTGCALISGWVVERAGVEDDVEAVEVEVKVEVRVKVEVDEGLGEAPIIPDGFLFSAT